MAYLIESANGFKNKEIEHIVLADNIDSLFSVKNPYETNLSILIDSTISNISDNSQYYKGSFKDLDLNNLVSKLPMNKQEFEELEKTIEANDIKVFLKTFQELFIKKSKDKDVKIYDLVGAYVETINSIANKKLINKDHMNQMVESITNLESRKESINIGDYLRSKIMDYRSTIEKPENSNFLYYNLQSVKDVYEDIMTNDIDNLTDEEIVSKFYNKANELKFKEPFNHEKIFIDDGFAVKTSSIGEDISRYSAFNGIKQKIKNTIDLKDVSLEQAKEALKVLCFKKDDLIDFVSDNSLSKIKENPILGKLKTKESLEGLGLDKISVEKILTLNEAIDLNHLVRDLSGSELNINATKLFYSKFGVDMNDPKSEKQIDALFKRFSELKETSGVDKNNILLLIALSSFNENTKKYSKKMEASYLELLNKSLSTYDASDLKTLNSIEDKWLKWSICYNREIKDSSVFLTNIKPERFNFTHFQKTKKALGLNETTPEDVEIIQVATILKQLAIKDITMDALRPKNAEEKSALADFLNLDDYRIDLSSHQIKDRESFYTTIRIYKEINQNEKLIKTIEEGTTPVSYFFKTTKDSVKQVLNNLGNYSPKELNAIGKMLENTKVIPGTFKENINNYITYYSNQMDKVSVQEYKRENSSLPLFDTKVNENHEIKSLTVLDFASVINGEVGYHCMKYNGASFKMLNYMFDNPNKMVITQLEKDGVGISNAATWTRGDTICFDSIETTIAETKNANVIINAYKEQSLKMLIKGFETGIERITMGKSDYNNDKISYKDLAINRHNSSHPLVSIPLNEISYSDAKGHQSIIFSLNAKDLYSHETSNYIINSLKDYSNSKDCKVELLKEFIPLLKTKLDEVISNNPNLKNSIHMDKLSSLENEIDLKLKALDKPMSTI